MSFDHLNLGKDDKVRKILQKHADGMYDEIILYSNRVTKVNRKAKSQQRILVITDKAIYNFTPGAAKTRSFSIKNLFESQALPTDQKSGQIHVKNTKSTTPLIAVGQMKRRIALKQIHTISVSAIVNEIVLHVPNEYDYLYRVATKKDIEQIVRVTHQSSQQINHHIKVWQFELNNLSQISENDKAKTKKNETQEQYMQRKLQVWQKTYSLKKYTIKKRTASSAVAPYTTQRSLTTIPSNIRTTSSSQRAPYNFGGGHGGGHGGATANSTGYLNNYPNKSMTPNFNKNSAANHTYYSPQINNQNTAQNRMSFPNIIPPQQNVVNTHGMNGSQSHRQVYSENFKSNPNYAAMMYQQQQQQQAQYGSGRNLTQLQYGSGRNLIQNNNNVNYTNGPNPMSPQQQYYNNSNSSSNSNNNNNNNFAAQNNGGKKKKKRRKRSVSSSRSSSRSSSGSYSKSSLSGSSSSDSGSYTDEEEEGVTPSPRPRKHKHKHKHKQKQKHNNGQISLQQTETDNRYLKPSKTRLTPKNHTPSPEITAVNPNGIVNGMNGMNINNNHNHNHNKVFNNRFIQNDHQRNASLRAKHPTIQTSHSAQFASNRPMPHKALPSKPIPNKQLPVHNSMSNVNRNQNHNQNQMQHNWKRNNNMNNNMNSNRNNNTQNNWNRNANNINNNWNRNNNMNNMNNISNMNTQNGNMNTNNINNTNNYKHNMNNMNMNMNGQKPMQSPMHNNNSNGNIKFVSTILEAKQLPVNNKEAYLPPQLFWKVFQMTKQQFYVLKPWRQKQLKRNTGFW